MQMLGLGTLLYLSLEHLYSAQYCNMAGGEREERSKGQKQSGADGRTKTIDPAKPEKYTATVSCFRLSSLSSLARREIQIYGRAGRAIDLSGHRARGHSLSMGSAAQRPSHKGWYANKLRNFINTFSFYL